MHRTQTWHRCQQSTGVRVLWCFKDCVHIVFFDLFTAAHDHYAIGDLGHHAHIVGDENYRHLHFILQCANQLQNLRLYRHIQRGGRFVGNQQ